ncbi:hypothetical protein [Methylobacterium sp. WL9]|uniref:hypothetical protein n=1 Tax=Methylobacterium sp. WL9 TaxID=2603898 RepID=UPI0011CB1345|nr:hypothetical protein [Methylobacterium sp. WL9]TXN24004.1 hypothetical protein FV217_04880 [Methylobacterium sp. WL9]
MSPAATLTILLPAAAYAALVSAMIDNGSLGAAVGMVRRAARPDDGVVRLRINSAVAWSIVTSLASSADTRGALAALEAAYWGAGEPIIDLAQACEAA